MAEFSSIPHPNTEKRRHLKPPVLQTHSKINDPFARLIIKDNRSPNLRPVRIASSRQVKTCRSEEKLKPWFFLPPISPPPKQLKQFESNSADRSTICTPYFENRIKPERTLNLQNSNQLNDRESSKGSNLGFEDTFGPFIRNN